MAYETKLDPEDHIYLEPDELIKNLKVSTAEEASAKLRDHIDNLENVSLNVAITGMTGAGKSTFISALRGLNDDEEESSPTGVTETTMVPTMFPHPSMPNVKIWDLPGIGSPKFKAKQYLRDVKFDTYDFFIILSADRFKENDLMLAEEIKKKNKPFYFVRSKIDNDIRSEKKKKKFNEQQVLSKIKDDCRRNLKKLGDPKVFLVSSHELEKYDFQALMDHLEGDLPEHKRYALVQSLPVCSLQVLEKKKQYLRRMIWLTAFGSGAIAMTTIPGLAAGCDIGIVMAFFTRSFQAFGLDEKSLQSLSERVNKPVDELKSVMKSCFANGITVEVVRTFFSTSKVDIAMKVEYVLSSIPLMGALPAGGISLGTIFHLLSKGLNQMADDAKAVLKVAGLE
ncbi:interferon-inducible GTPase 5-like [Colossoma macropomum]|uniref:interferon-inducible GTPase 5-like n=1 Tax=Colossoma macropomum TaxID=42526 RepID=UPI0018643C38|nr:interferon-inducible GTPase 5-like [Colossoma macropomum]